MSPKRGSHRSSHSAIKKQAIKDTPFAKVTQPSVSTNTRDGAVVPEYRYQAAGLRNWQWGLIILLAVLFFVLYLTTTHRSLPPGDSGELITAAWNLGVAHQPGYPTFTILSHIAGLLPVGTPAFRMNLLSALLDSLALGVLAFGALGLLQARSSTFNTKFEKLIPITGVIGGVGLLGISTAFWQYSNVAEVFALNNLLSALMIVLMLEWVRKLTRSCLLWLSGFCAGLALTNQLTVVLLAPGLLTILVGGLLRWRREMRSSFSGQRLREKGEKIGLPFRDMVIAAGFLIAGLLPYIYLPIAAGTDPPINLGDPSTLSNFWRVVIRFDYGTFSLTADSVQGDRFQQLVFLGHYFVQSFTPAGVILAVSGIIWFARRQQLEGIGLGLAFLFGGPLFAMFANPQLNSPLTHGVFARFYILPGLPLSFFVAAGIVLIIETVRGIAAKYRQTVMPSLVVLIGLIATLAMLVVVVIARFPSLDIHNNRVVEHYGKELLEPLEPDSLLIITDDYNFNAVVYTQLVLGFRTDVVAIEAEFLKTTWYIPQLKRHHPEITIPFDRLYEGKNRSLADLIRDNLKYRPVYVAGEIEEDLTKSYDKVNWGLSYRLLNKGEEPDTFALMRPVISSFTGFHYPERVYPPTSWESIIARQYGRLAFCIAADLQKDQAQPDADFVEKMYRIAILNAPEQHAPYKNLGLLLWKNGGSPAEIVAQWEKYLQEVPNDPDREAIRKIITQLAP